MVDYWNKVLKLAQKATKKREVPIGAIIVCDKRIIASGYNTREKKYNILGHAEIAAIQKAAKRKKTWKLEDCEMYVSLKPCSMCEKIIYQSRLKKVHYLLDKPANKKEYSRTDIVRENSNDYQIIYKEMLSNFFKKFR